MDINNSLSGNVTTTSSLWTEEGEELVSAREELQVAHNFSKQAILAVCYLIIGIISLGGSATMLLVTWRHPTLHTPYMACVVCMAIADIIISFSFNLPIGIFLATGFSVELTRIGCWVFRFLRVLGLLLGVHLLSLLALERYIFFIHPLRYGALCSKRNMTAAVALLTVIASGITSMGYFLHTLQFYSTFGFCQLRKNFLNTIIITVTYALPNTLIQPFIILRIGRMLRRTRCQVAAASSNPSSSLATLSLNLSSALRVILLTSGLYWVTYVPSASLGWELRRHGYSPELLETLPYHYITYISSISNIVLFSLPPALNPLVHLYVNKELRMFTMKDMRVVRERLRVCKRQTASIGVQMALEEVHIA